MEEDTQRSIFTNQCSSLATTNSTIDVDATSFSMWNQANHFDSSKNLKQSMTFDSSIQVAKT